MPTSVVTDQESDTQLSTRRSVISVPPTPGLHGRSPMDALRRQGTSTSSLKATATGPARARDLTLRRNIIGALHRPDAFPAAGRLWHAGDMPPAEPLSVQQRMYPDVMCFGCGHANAKGLRLRSYETGPDAATASFTPWPEHDNGWGFLNGGIIATVLDCHTGAAMMLASERRGLLAPGGGFAYVTAGIDVRYLRPTPLQGPLELHARVTQADEARMTVTAELVAEDKVRATGEALWRRWRPR